jgi:hypothetical protein
MSQPFDIVAVVSKTRRATDGGKFSEAVVGACLFLAGGLGLAGLFFVAYGQSEAAQAWAVRLGLAGAALGSALAQSALLVGAWMIWRARRRKG